MEILRGLMHITNTRHMAFEQILYERLGIIVSMDVDMRNSLFKCMLKDHLIVAHYARCYLWTWFYSTPSEELLMPEYADGLNFARARRFIVTFQVIR